MKRKLTIIVYLLAITLSLVACSNEKGQDYLNAKVVKITEAEIMVECIDESTNQFTGTRISVSKEVISANGVPNIEVGDRIRVVYDFDKVNKRSTPAKIEKVYAIYLLDENGEVINN